MARWRQVNAKLTHNQAPSLDLGLPVVSVARDSGRVWGISADARRLLGIDENQQPASVGEVFSSESAAQLLKSLRENADAGCAAMGFHWLAPRFGCRQVSVQCRWVDEGPEAHAHLLLAPVFGGQAPCAQRPSITSDAAGALCQLLLERLVEAAGAKRGLVAAVGDEGLSLIASAGAGVSSEALTSPMVQAAVEVIRADASSRLVHDVSAVPELQWLPSEWRQESVVVIPLAMAGEVVGAILMGMEAESVELDADAEPIRGYVECVGLLLQLMAHGESREMHDGGSVANSNGSPGRFLAVVSHELRTPLTPIMAAGAVLRDRAESLSMDAVRRSGDMITEAAQRMLHLVNDLIDIAAIEAAHLKLKRRECDLNAVIERICQRVAPTVQRKRQRLVTDLASLPILHIDPNRIDKALSHLVENAVKYTSEGGTVRISARLSDAGDEAVVSISDDGIGLAADDIPLVFAPFRQVDDSTTRPFEGAGLGLYLTRALVELHDGRVWVESEGVGCGSTFYVSLPAPPTPAVATAGPAADDLSGIHVLVAEDNSAIQQAVQLMLAEATVELADNGKQALLCLERKRPDIVLMDIIMPVMSGEDAIAEIRRRPELADLPVIALTAAAMHGDRERLMSMGFDEYLAKPFEPDDLRALIRRLTGERTG